MADHVQGKLKSSPELRAGFRAFALFLGMLVLSLILSRLSAVWSGYEIQVRYNFLSNLTAGAPVRLAGGIQVGHVRNIRQEGMQTYVTLYLDNITRDRISRDRSWFGIFSLSLFGAKYINLSMPGLQDGEAVIRPGDSVRGFDALSIDQTMLSFSNLFRERSSSDVIEATRTGLSKLAGQLREIRQENAEDTREAIYQASQAFDKIMRQLDRYNKLADSIKSRTGQPAGMDTILQDMQQTMNSLGILEAALARGEGNIMRLQGDIELQENIRSTTGYAKEFIGCIRDRPWVLIYKEPCQKK